MFRIPNESEKSVETKQPGDRKKGQENTYCSKHTNDSSRSISLLRNDSDKRAALIENMAHAICAFADLYVIVQSITTGGRPSGPSRISAASRSD